MNDRRRPAGTPFLVAVAMVLLLLAAYLAGYFWLGKYESVVNDNDEALYVSRDYRQQWLANLYQPAGKLEAWMRCIEVTISGPESGRL
jgi:hypothetical protein